MFRILSRFFNSTAKPVSVCIIGSGPAGFYCAQKLLKILPTSVIHIYEKLPIPFGLVRFGVAPDHPEVKNVINTFNKVALDSRIKFVGNVTLGKDVSLKDFTKAYHAVILAYGADQDIKLNIPGENLDNVISARKFVGWYNGFPNDKDLSVDLSSETVSIFGHGNVAIDVARILLKSVNELKHTDITEYSLNKLAESRIREIFLIGRRGPLQVAFTIKELREILKLSNVQTYVDDKQFDDVAGIIQELPRPRKRLTELLLKASIEYKKDDVQKILHIIFLRSPLEISGSKSVDGVQLCINQFKDEIGSSPERCFPTNEKEFLSSKLIFRSIGYKSSKVDPEIPFNYPNFIGNSRVQPGVYSTGWLCTGPSGVILSTMTNAFNTANLILEDVKNGTIKLQDKPGYDYIRLLLNKKGIITVNWNGWNKVNQIEIQKGKLKNKPREKIIDINEMLNIGGSCD